MFSFTSGPPWVVVAAYGSVIEADFAAATLEEAGIPARVTGAHLVPEIAAAEQAKELVGA